jgi:endonuclease YncB( thermonuclease family)
MMRRPQEFANFPEELLTFLQENKRTDAPRYGPYIAVIKHHVDGDTLDIYCDAGLNEYPYKIVRLEGIDTAERFSGDRRDEGYAAWQYLQQLAPVGTPCVFYSCEKDTETFGRYVGKIMLPGLKDLGQLMIEAGFVEESL